MFSGVVANGNLQSHGSHSHGMERRYHLFFFYFRVLSFARICQGLCICFTFPLFLLARFYHHGVWSALRLVRTYGILTIIRRTRGRPLLLGWMRWYKKDILLRLIVDWK